MHADGTGKHVLLRRTGRFPYSGAPPQAVVWSRDSRTIFSIFGDQHGEKLMALDVQTGPERTVGPGLLGDLTVAPDGRTLGYLQEPDQKPWKLVLATLQGRILEQVRLPEAFSSVDGSPNLHLG
jgi:hypothetical protein